MNTYGQTTSTLWGPSLLKSDAGSTDAIEVSVHTLPRPLRREFRHVFDERNLQLEGIKGGGSFEDSTDSMNEMGGTGAGGAGGGLDNNSETGTGSGGSGNAEFLCIPTNQQAKEDLVAVGVHIEQEKDRLLNTYMNFARVLCDRIRREGYWADFIDPCSGLPMLTLNCNKVYSEVDGMECCLGYKSYNAGFCKILTHPKWGSAVYPATIFAYAPRNLVLQILRGYPLAITQLE